MRELVLGLSIGFGAGISPGPLLALVVATTLRSGFRAGARVAISPLITDGPIILISLFFLTSLPQSIQTGVSLAGALFVIFLGIQTFRDASQAMLASDVGGQVKQDLIKGAMVNALSPHPWIFWISVGAPILSSALDTSAVNASLFLFGFYFCLIGSKILLAAASAAGRARLSIMGYRTLLRIAGLLLIVNGSLLFYSFI